MPNEPFDPSHDDPLADETLLRALALLERGEDPQDPGAGTADPELAAALGAVAELAFDTEPVAPSPAGRRALLQAVAAEPRHGVSSIRRTRPRPPRRSWPAYAVAAVLLGCMLGLGYFAGMLQSARDTIERQRRELSHVRADVDSLRAAVASAQHDLETTRGRLEMVTLTARQAYPLNVRRDARAADEVDDAKGVVYVCGQHQQWLLSLTGLKQPPAGEVYRLWFMTEDGPVDGGVLEVDEHGDAAAEDLSMPRGTHGFSVSLEPADEPVSAPHELILLGDEPVRL